MFFNIWVTKSCNLNCRYCYEGKEKETKNLEEENIDKIIKFIESVNKLNKKIWVNFHGGEPLLNFKIIKELILKLKSKEIECKFSFTTNGIDFNEDVIEYVIKNEIEVSYSIDGKKVVNDINRVYSNGMSSYETVSNNLIRAIEYIPDIRIRATFDSDSYKYLGESIRYFLRLGCKTIICSPNYFDNRWDESKIIELGDIIKKLYVELGEKRKYVALFDSSNYKMLGKCSGGNKEFNIDCNGDIYPCVYSVGNADHIIGTISEGLNNEKIKNIREVSRVDNPKCKGCEYIKYCIGNRCKYLNHNINKNYFEPIPSLCLIENEKVKNILFNKILQ